MTISMDDVNQRYEIPGLEPLTASLNDGGGLPAPYYFAPEIYRLEQEKIFAKSWSYACHESAVAKPGDYAVTRAGNVPIIVTHGRDGELRAFVNACRHRLHSLAEENGNKPLLQCPYHGWTYGLDGQLRTAPRSDRERNFDCSTISLEPVAVERWDQWVFVNPDPGAAPLAGYVSGIADRAATINEDLQGYEFQVRYEYDMDCNWKLWAENAVECYHCPTLHKSSFGKTYQTSPDDYEIDSDAHTIWHKAPIRWLPSEVSPDGLKGFRFAFTFPSSFFALDDYVGFVGSVQPVSPEKCWAFVDMYAKPGADPVVVKEWLDMWDRTLIEDKRATDIQQIGYNSGKIPAGRLMLDSESPLQSFTQGVVDALHA
ncbi:MAG: aromatic ring-hydroxylating dioxygenase subunit alpha [Gordonia sp. (in: high G+C Gram-positive bacteria)]|uniref:aromatic ring-hydroxylating oxygenase subunit alpha n=1 Tax=Gordonia TaxID=2053 RepID=UPI003265FC54